jgi:hypothetical protein
MTQEKAPEVVHMRPMPDDTRCAVHDWPTEGLAKRLVQEMRATHGKGGVNVCVECIARAKRSLTR